VLPSVPLNLNTGPDADGQRLVNPNSFADPLNRLGSLGRNALTGPGLFNVDLSISRSWPVPLLGESARLSIRADAYNTFNHANLNNPSPDRVHVGDTVAAQVDLDKRSRTMRHHSATHLMQKGSDVQFVDYSGAGRFDILAHEISRRLQAIPSLQNPR
jgi:hypothetical protein